MQNMANLLWAFSSSEVLAPHMMDAAKASVLSKPVWMLRVCKGGRELEVVVIAALRWW